ncbi:MAG: hypothetical protein IT247_08450 [Bacteroidia bacterium]|nr:hypothetical protein [Bacteroidia bacterium]
MSKYFAILSVLLLQGARCLAQDPELLMNETKVPLLHYQKAYSSSDARYYNSYGASAGVTLSMANLFFGGFSSRRFRMGDLIGADVGSGYTESNITYHIMLWGRAEAGLQAYYGITDNLDAGIKTYWLLNAGPVNAGTFSPIHFQPVIRYKKLITEVSYAQRKNNSPYSHFQWQLKYIFNSEDSYRGIVFRYENYQGNLKSNSNYLSIGLSLHFASNR